MKKAALRIGIIGAENSHTAAIAKVINIEKKIKGVSVDYVWGETDQYAKEAAKAGKIPNIVKNSRQMLGKVDAVIVDHRHGKYHLKAVLPFVEQGLPVFIDKPFCFRAENGKEFLKRAKKNKAPVTSFSVLPHQKSFMAFARKASTAGDIISAATYGPCDMRSKWGGIFFYGTHQVDMALKCFGYNVSSVLVTKKKASATGQLIYPQGLIVTLNFIDTGYNDFAMTAVGTEKTVHQRIAFDESPYLTGIKIFTRMFKTGEEPEKYEHMLKPVQVLEAMEQSVKSGQIEKVLR